MQLSRTSKPLVAILASAALLMAVADRGSQEPSSEFSSSTLDVGIVVSDVARAVQFYTDLIGFTEVPGFAVDADFCSAAGLTDGHALRVSVLVLKKDETATKLKLMSLPDVESAKPDNAFIHSSLGISYVTVHTTGLGPILERLAEAGVKPLAKGPVPLPGAGADGPHLAVVRDPDGNLVELIGTL